MDLNEPAAGGPAPLSYRARLPELADDHGLWEQGRSRHDMPDHRDGAVYLMAPELRLAVEVAMVTGRPLLLRGEPGTGKSAVGAYLARNLGWRYYEHVVTSATRAEDFLWEFDAVKRLSDAEAGGKDLDDFDYVRPGALWWALDPETAELRGRTPPAVLALEQRANEPFSEANRDRAEGHAVVLIDELDKADPDVPNGLLVPLGSGRFEVRETGSVIDARTYEERAAITSSRQAQDDPGVGTLGRILVIVTTNEERQLPPAFVRRCVVHTLPSPDRQALVDIATLHVYGPDGGPASAQDVGLFEALADQLDRLRRDMRTEGRERLPSTAEYLDAVRACRDLAVFPDDADPTWRAIVLSTLRKPPPEL